MTTQPIPCVKCSNPAPAGTRFCPNCGVPLSVAAVQPVVSAAPPVAAVPPATPASAAGPPPYLTPTILCSQCNTEFNTELKFCPRCDAAAGQGTYRAPVAQGTHTASTVQNTFPSPVAPGWICGGCGSPVAPGGAFCMQCGTPVGVTPDPGPRREYAGFGIRVLADLIDTVVLVLIAVVFAWTAVFDVVISFILMTLYGAITESSVHQSSLGKRAMGLKVTDLE